MPLDKSDPGGVFRLTSADVNTDLWLRLSGHLNRRLNDLRRQNDNENTGKRRTASLRGRIAECKLLLSLAVEEEELTPDE